MKRFSLITGTLVLFAASLYVAFMQGNVVSDSTQNLSATFGSAPEVAPVLYTGIRAEVVEVMAAVLNGLLSVFGNSLFAAIVALAVIVELVLLYPSVSIQLKLKKIHMFHKKLIDKFEAGELSVSSTEYELEKLYAVNEKIHSRGALLVVIQLIVFLSVLWGLALIVRSPQLVAGSWNLGNISLLASPASFLVPLSASLLYFLHALIKISIKGREDYISPVQTLWALTFAVIGAFIVYTFSATFAVALTAYFVTLVGIATIRYLVVEHEAAAWGKRASRELIEMLQKAEPAKDRFELFSRKWNSLPVIRHINFNLLEEALSMSLGLILALNVLGGMASDDSGKFMVNAPVAVADSQCSSTCSNIPFFSSYHVNTTAPDMTCRALVIAIGVGIPGDLDDKCREDCCKSTTYGNRNFERGNLKTFGSSSTSSDNTLSNILNSWGNKLSCSGPDGSQTCYLEYDYSPVAQDVVASCPTGRIYKGDTKALNASGGLKYVKFNKASGASVSFNDAADSNHNWSTNVTFNGVGDVTLRAYSTHNSSNDDTCTVNVKNSPAITNAPATSNNGLAYGTTFDFNANSNTYGLSWSKVSGPGSINSSTGVYSAGGATSGTVKIRLSDGIKTVDKTFNIQGRTINAINVASDITINNSYTFSVPTSQGPYNGDIDWSIAPVSTFAGDPGSVAGIGDHKATYVASADPEAEFVITVTDPYTGQTYSRTVKYNNKCSEDMFVQNYLQRKGFDAARFMDGSGSTFVGNLGVLTNTTYRFYLNNQLIYDKVGIEVVNDTSSAISGLTGAEDYVQFTVTGNAPQGATGTVRVYDATADTTGCDFTIPFTVQGQGLQRRSAEGVFLAPIDPNN